MPQHASDSGHVDFVLPPEKIAYELARLVKTPYTSISADKIEREQVKEIHKHTEELKKVLSVVKSKSGVDFFLHYKQASIYRRVVRRMVLNKLERLEDYYDVLSTNAKEVDALYDDFLINVTHFFRDPDFYKMLTTEVFPSILKREKTIDPVRIWVAGCATGEEAYSIGICLIEFLEKHALSVSIQIFASDLDTRAIEKARLGLYPVSALQEVPPGILKKYFVKTSGHYQIIKPVREICVL